MAIDMHIGDGTYSTYSTDKGSNACPTMNNKNSPDKGNTLSGTKGTRDVIDGNSDDKNRLDSNIDGWILEALGCPRNGFGMDRVGVGGRVGPRFNWGFGCGVGHWSSYIIPPILDISFPNIPSPASK